MKTVFMIMMLLSSQTCARLSEAWTRIYDGPGKRWDNAVACITDDHGNVYVAGNSTNTYGKSNFILLKYTSSGLLEWESKYVRQNYDDVCETLTRDSDGNFYLAGYQRYSDRLVTVKINAGGKPVWERILSGFLLDPYPITAVTDRDNNVIVRGDDFIYGTIIAKYDSSGVELLQRRFVDFVSYFEANNLAIDKEGNLFLLGHVYSGSDDICVMKLTPQGDTLWSHVYNSGLYDHGVDMEIDDSGNVFVTGETGGSPFVFHAYKYLTFKIGNDGIRKWERIHNGGGSGGDIAMNVMLGADGSVFVTGEASLGGDNTDITTIRYNSGGDSVWVRNVRGYGIMNDVGYGLCFDSRGNIVVSGIIHGFDSSENIVTLLYDPFGNQIGYSQFSGPLTGQEVFADVKAGLNGEVFVCGMTKGFHPGNEDLFIIKYDVLVDVEPQEINVNGSGYRLDQNYPNPFNPSTKIAFSIPEDGPVDLKLYDIAGRLTATILSSYRGRGNYEAEFNAGEIPAGVYFYTLTANNALRCVRKMIVTK